MIPLNKTFLLTVLITASAARLFAQERYRAEWESLKKYECPEWFRDAKFGIFIHWGVYSVPGFGNEWYPRNMYVRGSDEFKHHIAQYGPQNKFGYKDFIPLLDRKSTRLNSSHQIISYAVFCLKKK